MDTFLRIGQLAKAAGMAVSALRFYDQIGLLPSRGRIQGDGRAYLSGDLEKLKSIERLQALGFTLAELVRIRKSRANFAGRRALLLAALKERLKKETQSLRAAKARIGLLKRAIALRGPHKEWGDGLAAFVKNGS